MMEAYSYPWQEVRGGGTTGNMSLLEAAKVLQVGVFSSGPLGEVGGWLGGGGGGPESLWVRASASGEGSWVVM